MTQNQDVNRLIIAAGAMKTVGVSIDVDGNETIITGNGSGGGAGDASLAEQEVQTALLTTIDAKTNSKGLYLEFVDIALAPVVPATDLAGWNAYFGFTDVFQSVDVGTNWVVLHGVGGGQTTKDELFAIDLNLQSFVDNGIFTNIGHSFLRESSVVYVELASAVFSSASILYLCASLKTFIAPELIELGKGISGSSPLADTVSLENLYLPKVKSIGAYMFNAD